MGFNTPKKKAVLLLAIWIVFCMALNAISVFRKGYLEMQGIEIEASTKPDVFFIFILFCVITFFLPMLSVIHRYAKLAQMKWLTNLIKILLFLFSFALTIALIVLCCMFFA